MLFQLWQLITHFFSQIFYRFLLPNPLQSSLLLLVFIPTGCDELLVFLFRWNRCEKRYWLKETWLCWSIYGGILKIKKACLSCINGSNGAPIKSGRPVSTLTLRHLINVSIKTVHLHLWVRWISCGKNLFEWSSLIEFPYRDGGAVQRRLFCS